MEPCCEKTNRNALEAMQRYRILDTPPDAYAAFSITFAQAPRTC